jgi:hypothetical protein
MKGEKRILIINLVFDFLTRRRCGRSTVLFFFLQSKISFYFFVSFRDLIGNCGNRNRDDEVLFILHKLMAYFSLSFSRATE